MPRKKMERDRESGRAPKSSLFTSSALSNVAYDLNSTKRLMSWNFVLLYGIKFYRRMFFVTSSAPTILA